MAWTSPLTAVANTTLTAAQWNTFLRDNLNAQGPTVATAAGQYLVTTGFRSLTMRTPGVQYIGTSDTTNSSTVTVLDSDGAEVIALTGTMCMVTIGSQISNSTAGAGGLAAIDLSGDTERVADDVNCVRADSGTASDTFKLTYTTIYDPINPGLNTFGMRYRATGGGTATFSGRLIVTVPF
jgi:hypothetical protein